MKIESAAEKITSSVEASSVPSQANLVPTIAQAMKMVKDCGIQEKTVLMHTTSLLIMKPEFRELLGVLETNEGRFDFIEREHEMKKATYIIFLCCSLVLNHYACLSIYIVYVDGCEYGRVGKKRAVVTSFIK
jgi:hypothetical protein